VKEIICGGRIGNGVTVGGIGVGVGGTGVGVGGIGVGVGGTGVGVGGTGVGVGGIGVGTGVSGTDVGVAGGLMMISQPDSATAMRAIAITPTKRNFLLIPSTPSLRLSVPESKMAVNVPAKSGPVLTRERRKVKILRQQKKPRLKTMTL